MVIVKIEMKQYMCWISKLKHRSGRNWLLVKTTKTWKSFVDNLTQSLIKLINYNYEKFCMDKKLALKESKDVQIIFTQKNMNLPFNGIVE